MSRNLYSNKLLQVINVNLLKSLGATPSLITLAAITGSSMTLANDADNAKQGSLEEISVYGQQINTQSSTGSRLDLSIQETPATVEIISGDSIRDRLDFTVLEAVTRSAGFSNEANPGNGGQSIAARGFRGQGAVTKLFDGTSYFNAFGTVTFPFDTWGVERIEVLKGPSSVLYGEGGIGGAINVIPKKPQQEQSRDIRLTIGEDDTTFVGIGLGGGLTDELAYRIDYSNSQSDTWVDNSESQAQALSLALGWQPNEDFNLSLRYDYGDQEPSNYFGTPVVNGDFVPGLEGRNFQVGDSEISYEDQSIRLKAEWNISDELTMQAELYRLETDRFWRNAEGSEFIEAGANAGMVRRFSPGVLGHDMDHNGLRVNFALNNSLGDIDLRSTVGFEVNDVSFFRPFNFGSGEDFIDPNNFNAGVLADITSDLEPVNRFSADLTQYALFAESQLKFTEQLALVLGLRYENADTDFEETRPNPTFTDISLNQSVDTVTGRIGMVYDVAESTALYAQYSTGADHPSGGVVRATTQNSQVDFIETEQFELGIKQQLLDGRLQWSLAYFDITRNNLIEDDPTSLDPDDVITVPEQTSDGIEFNFNVQALESLKIYGNASVLDAEREGQTTPLVPETTANLGFVWAPVDRLRFVADARYVGEREGTNTPPLPSYIVFDASARVALNSDLSLTFKVDNAFDEEYASATYFTGNWLVGKPRTFSFTADYRF
jgi:iron complex outermembrane receptor protein